jgi:hypothetical protein
MDTAPLRNPLLANAAFSSATGLALALGANHLGALLGPDVPPVYLVLGLGLLAFAAGLTWLAFRPRPVVVVAVLGADLAWIVATTTVLAVSWPLWEPAGVAAVGLTNAVVGALVLFQGRGLRRVYELPGEPGRFEVCVRVGAPVGVSRLWPVMADLGGISRHMADLVSSAVDGDEAPGEGAVRTCENRRGQRWSERCVRWSEGASFDVRFLTDAPGFPFPFSDMVGGWRLVPKGPACDVEVWWRVVPRRQWLAPVLLPLMAHGASATFAQVVASMVAEASGHPGEVVPVPRLRATFC